MQHLIEPLQNLGLTEKEAKVYLALLQLGPSTPYRIAEKAGIKRPTAYVIAEELVEKGFIVHVPGEEPKRYIARTPETFIEDREEKLREAKRILPELKSFQKGAAEKPSVLYFEGTEGMKQALMYRIKELHNTEVVGFYADPDFSTKETQAQSFDFNDYRIAHNIRFRGLLTDVESLAGFEKYIVDGTFKPKFIPKEMYSSNASFEFYPDFIKILFFDASVGVVIESPAVAKAMRQIFEMLWSRLGDEYDASRIISGKQQGAADQ